MNNFEPCILSEIGFSGLVELDENGAHRACILDLDEHAPHDRALVFLDAWRGFPRFGFVYLHDDVPIEGSLCHLCYPLTGDMGELTGIW